MADIVRTSAVGSGTAINVRADELTSIYTKLEGIITELESNAVPNISRLSELDYYEEGKAKEAMEVYAEANQKMLDLFDNYMRASALVIDVLNTMMEADQAIAEQIIARLEV
jgi:hypothetical protein